MFMLMLLISFSVSEEVVLKVPSHKLMGRKHRFISSESYNNGDTELLAYPKLKKIGLKAVRRTVYPPPSPASNQPSYYRSSPSSL
ncbi:hypothetical protein SUGI_0325960 [Cryptomeria japonica]|nr:hypothetical protein SUGI_0325960 [Cryptomeria japonica]